MSETPGSRPADPSSDGGGSPAPTSGSQDPWSAPGQVQQPSPEQPYDVPGGAQQYGQPPATGYQPPASNPPGQSAPVRGPGPQQYGQPEHGQASYAQQGFPAPGSGRGGYEPTEPGYGQQPGVGAPSFGSPAEGRGPDQSYSSQGYHQGQQGYPGQQSSGGQQPYGGQQSYAGQQAYSGQQPYAGQQPYPGQGYQPQPYGQAFMSDNDQRLWATLTHISIPFFGFVGPLVAYLLFKDRAPFLKESAIEALNFSILFSIAMTVSSVLTAVVLGAVLLPVIWVVAIVFCILGAIASNKGEVYRYPVNWRLVK